jgi:subtilisin-like proprotein convertase family protein
VKQKRPWVSAMAIGAALVTIALATTTAGAGTSGRLFFLNDAKRPIPDAPNGGGVLDKVTIRSGARIRDIEVGIRINHPSDGDLNIYLISPKGKFVELSTDNGGSGNNYGTGSNRCPRNPSDLTIFDDESGRSIRSGAPPFRGVFRPQSPLRALAGDRMEGTWRLQVFDDDSGGNGTIGCFALGIVPR